MKILLLEGDSSAMLIPKILSVFQTANVEFFKDLDHFSKNSKSDVLIVDSTVFEEDGEFVAEKVRSVSSNVPLLILMSADSGRKSFTYFKAGASGVIHRNASAEEFKKAITRILNNGRYVNEEVAQLIAEKIISNRPTGQHLLAELSPREKEIARLLVEGKTAKEIANVFNVKSNTIAVHQSRLFKKLQVKTLSQFIELVGPFHEQYPIN